MKPLLVPSLKEINSKSEFYNIELIGLAEFLYNNLDSNWEIYVKPFINSEQPDLAILNKNIGAAIFETFEDYAAAYSVKINKVSGGRSSSYTQKTFKQKVGDNYHKRNYPINVLDTLTENLINIYIPDIGHQVNYNRGVKKIIKKILYTPNLNREEANKLFSHHLEDEPYLCMIKEDLESINFRKIYDDFISSVGVRLEKSWYNELRFFFNPPFHKEGDGEKIKFIDKQRNYIEHSPQKHQRFKGLPGSGKTFVLAHRAAHIASKGKKVLLLTYNVTLICYIQEMLHKMPLNFNYKDIVITNYHHFCSIYFRENDTFWPKGENERDILDNKAPKQLEDMIQNETNILKRQYDAIIIDEVQDFELSYLESVKGLLTNNNELVIGGDDNQDIYGRGTEKLGQFSKGFSGPWGNLDYCFRLPEKIVLETNRFIEKYIPEAISITKYSKDTLFNPTLIWHDLVDDNINIIKSVFDQLIKKKTIDQNRTMILVPSYKIGIRIADLFKRENIKVLELFGDRNKKISFKYNSEGLKISTLQSFKGWEYDNILVYSPDTKYKRTDNMDKLYYTALTRAIKNLVVINRHDKYNGFGNSENWDKLKL